PIFPRRHRCPPIGKPALSCSAGVDRSVPRRHLVVLLAIDDCTLRTDVRCNGMCGIGPPYPALPQFLPVSRDHWAGGSAGANSLFTQLEPVGVGGRPIRLCSLVLCTVRFHGELVYRRWMFVLLCYSYEALATGSQSCVVKVSWRQCSRQS